VGRLKSPLVLRKFWRALWLRCTFDGDRKIHPDFAVLGGLYAWPRSSLQLSRGIGQTSSATVRPDGGDMLPVRLVGTCWIRVAKSSAERSRATSRRANIAPRMGSSV
jgi:hypothetical protein